MLNYIINIFKYPVAILSLLLFIDLGIVLFEIGFTIIRDFQVYQNFFIGMAIYLIIWSILFKKRTSRLFIVLEHEITHSIFALLSLNKIIAISAVSIDRYMQGAVHYEEIAGKTKGNWLITISPYFFSTLGVIIIGIIHISSPTYYPILMGLLGYTLLHHIYTIATTFRLSQPDIIKVGLPFSFLFLPSANLAMMIIILTQIPNDSIYLKEVIDYLSYSLTYYGNFMLSFF